MNINPEHQPELNLNAETAMEMCMDALFDMVINPAIKNDLINDEDEIMLGAIGLALKAIAEKARAYEELQGKAEENNHYNN
tara:strand:- start:3559 stop:3801 length:243 start_codon:yes stop_codon:yes gene_type:complete